MRIRVNNTWIAGHPDHDEAEWSLAQDAVWSPTRGGGWQQGGGWERAEFEDAANPAFSLSFGVTRCFARQREAVDHITRLHSRDGLHPWAGHVFIRFDRQHGGHVEIDAGECVIQLAQPVQSLGGTARLTLTCGYIIHGGVLGAQPVLVDPVDPGQDDYGPEYDNYEY